MSDTDYPDVMALMLDFVHESDGAATLAAVGRS